MVGRNSLLPLSKEATMENQNLREHLICASQSTNGETKAQRSKGTYTVHWMSSWQSWKYKPGLYPFPHHHGKFKFAVKEGATLHSLRHY